MGVKPFYEHFKHNSEEFESRAYLTDNTAVALIVNYCECARKLRGPSQVDSGGVRIHSGNGK